MNEHSTLRLQNPDRGGHWLIPRVEFDAAQKALPWLCFSPLTKDQLALFETWAEGRPDVAWVDTPALAQN